MIAARVRSDQSQAGNRQALPTHKAGLQLSYCAGIKSTESGRLVSRIRSFTDILTRYGAAIAGVRSFTENDSIVARLCRFLI